MKECDGGGKSLQTMGKGAISFPLSPCKPLFFKTEVQI
jgi:hypothetical protein